MLSDEQLNPLVRGRAVHCLIQSEKSLTWLVELLDQEDIKEEVYLALYQASRQSGFRVCVSSEGGYDIVRPQPT